MDADKTGGLAARIIAAPIMLLARIVSVAIILVFWFTIVLFVWALMVLRVLVVLAVRVTVEAFRGAGTYDYRRLEHVVMIWPTGLVLIVGILFGRLSFGSITPQEPRQMLLETLLAMLFFAWMIFSFQLAAAYVPALVEFERWAWPLVFDAGHAVGQALWSIVRGLRRFWPW